MKWLRKLLIGATAAAAAVVPVAAVAPAAPVAALYSPINFRWTGGCVGTSYSCYYANLTADRGTFNGRYTIFRSLVRAYDGSYYYGPWKNVANGTTSSYVAVPLGKTIAYRGFQTG